MECSPDVLEEHRSDLVNRRPFRDRTFHAGPPEGEDSRTLRLSGMPVFDRGDKFIGYRGVGVDITREVDAMKLSRQVLQTLEDSIESLDDGVVVFGPDGRMETCNSAYLHVLGLTGPYELVGKTFEEIQREYMHLFDTEGMEFESWLSERIQLHNQATGKPFSVRLKNGSWIFARECRMGDGGVVGVRTDVTELKRSEIEMEELKTRYQLILDSAGEGIIGLDTQGSVTFANQTAHYLLGYGNNALIGKQFHPDIQAITPEKNSIPLVYEAGLATHLINQPGFPI